MKKITFLSVLMLLLFTGSYAQFGCGSGVILTNGFTQNNITTTGSGGIENWNEPPTGPLVNANYYTNDVYLFQYTAGTTDELISMTTYSRNTWNGLGIFTVCDVTLLSGAIAFQSSTTANATKTVSATIGAGTTVYIATGQWNTPPSLDFDVVSFTATPVLTIPNCDAALTFPVNASSNASLLGDLKWTAATGNPTSYKLTMGTTTGGSEILNAVNVGNVLNYNVGDLQPGTTYYIKIVAANSIGDAVGCTEYSFTTCASNTSFFENFENAATGATSPMPTCWEKKGIGNTYVATGAAAPMSTPNRLYMSATPTANGYAITPALSNLQAQTHRLKFKMYATSNNRTMQVGYFTDLSQIDSFVEIETLTIPGTTAASALTFTVQPPSLPAGIINLVFRNTAEGGNTVLYIDDVSWEQVPLCSDVSVVNVTDFDSNSATITWNPGGFESNWEYVYATATVTDPSTLTPIAAENQPTALLSGLEAATVYKVWIRADCGNGALGNWLLMPFTFKTSCAPVTAFNENFDSYPNVITTPLPACWTKFGSTGSTYMTSGAVAPLSGPNRLCLVSGATTSSYAVMPPVSNLQANTHQLKFKAYASSSAGKIMQLGYYEFAGDVTSFNELTSFVMPGAAQSTATAFEYTPESVPDGIESLVFKVSGANGNGFVEIFIDDVKWEALPACSEVTEIVLSNITTTTVDLAWNPIGVESAWQYVYGAITVTDPNTLTPFTVNDEPNTTITGLTPSTTYKLWMRSNCETDLFGSWSESKTFTTLCTSTTLPYTIDFESATTPNLPSCTTKQNAGTGNNWETTSVNGNGFTGKVLRYSYNTTSAANAWFYTNSVELVAGTDYTVTYKYGNNSTTDIEKLRVAYGTAPVNTEMVNEIANHPSVTGGTPQNNATTFTPAVSGTYFIGFQAYSALYQWNLYLDNIVIAEETLGAETFDKNAFSAYPNPVKNNLNIRYNENISDVTVFNLLGQKLFTKSINATEAQVDMSNVTAGTYLVKVKMGAQVKTIKVIKE